MEEDFLLAIQLQAEYDSQASGDDDVRILHHEPKRAPGSGSAAHSGMSVVDPSWEFLDPTPDIRALFIQYNDMFFRGKLAGVEVKWSQRMTLSAGICSYEGRGGLCSIRLSEPLLKLRPRKDLVETLLHEMIHALLYVTHNNKDHGSHGPEFCKHMNRINSLTGAAISVYHNFHDEVEEYRKHWWLCDGPCQKKKPYYGYVKRSMNRPPSSVDPWWSDHQRTCGGKFHKVKDPEKWGQQEVNKDGSSKANPTNSSDGKGKSHGVDIRTIIPFSGVGHKLVETNTSGVPPKAQPRGSSSGLNKILPHSPSGLSILNIKSLLPSQENTVNTVGSAPKISLANTKVFMNVNGSPIKLPAKRPSASQGESTPSRISDFFLPNQKTSSTSVPSASTPFTSQGLNCVESTGQPAKRPRLEDKKTLDSFFIKTPRGNVTKSELVPKVPSTAAPAAATPASTSQQSMMVSCPICRSKVLESNINQHLDICLAAC